MPVSVGRANQRLRTRKDLLKAAATLLKEGRTPSLDDVAEAALVSRATAYRYFPSTDALLAEAALDVATPDAADLFGSDAPGDPVARLEKVDGALHDMVLANEPALRLMLASTLQRAARGEGASDTPLRQNRRTPLIEAALDPARRQLKPTSADMLAKALALIIGTEAMVVLKDVLRVDDQEARKIKKWAIRALVDAARR
jgi:AcrR family transcriptional regulator